MLFRSVLAAILREYRPITPDADERFERGDELLFLTAREGESTLGEIPVIFTADDEPAPDPTRADPARTCPSPPAA